MVVSFNPHYKHLDLVIVNLPSLRHTRRHSPVRAKTECYLCSLKTLSRARDK